MQHLFTTQQQNSTLRLTITAAWNVDNVSRLVNDLNTLSRDLPDVSQVEIILEQTIPSPDSNAVYILHN